MRQVLNFKAMLGWLAATAMWVVALGCVIPASAQKRPDDEVPPSSKSVSTRTVYIRVPTPSADAQMAGLLLQTAAMVKGAHVTLETAGGKTLSAQTDLKGSCRFEKLAPSSYTYRITHPDFAPLTESITLEKGKRSDLMIELVSRYGTVAIGLGDKASEGAIVKVDDVALPPERIKIENGIILLTRVPVGKRKFSIEKDAYLPWAETYEVKPGANLLARTMAAATIKLKVKSEPGAEVYFEDEKRGLLDQDGFAEIGNLLPGPLNVRVIKPGFRDAVHKLELTLADRAPVLNAPLESVLDDLEFQESLTSSDNWYPRVPTSWELATALPKGRVVKSDEVALANSTSKANHKFNVLGDFRMEFTLRFRALHGAAWVVRAKDLTEYYLFELDRASAELRLYYCRASRCDKPVETQKVLADLSDTTRSYTITLEARGSKFDHRINTPNGDERLGGIFTHEALRYGGVGLRALRGGEMLEQDFFVRPLK